MVDRDDAERRARALRDGLSAPPRLPLPRPDAAGAAPPRVERERHFSAEQSRTLSIFAAENGISIHTMAEGAWAFVLSRYCGVPDAVFFTPDRSRRTTSPAGDGSGEAVRRIRVPEDEAVRDWLRGIQAERDRLRLAPRVRLDSVLRAAGWESAVIESCLDCREFSPDETGVRPAPTRDSASAPLALRLEANPRFWANLSADGSRFTAAAVDGLLEHFTGALDAFVREPDRPLASVEWMSASERERILVAFNRTERPYPSDRPAHALIEDVVDRDPSALAVESPSGGLTFGELEERANRLAHRLRAEGVAPDTPVGILLERSPEMVVALLGVLKAGGAYLPLDPGWPAARIAFILADARAPVVLTQESLTGSLPAVDARVVRVDAPALLSGAADRPRPAAGADDLAYVIYTSGSTGKPKGVLVTHRGLVNYLVWSADAYRVAGEPAPVHSPLAFDLTVTSLLTPLAAGGAVEMIPDREGVDGLVEALRRRKDRSVVKITPAHLEILASRLAPEEAKGCARVFVIGGEALRGETLAFWVRNAPDARYVNEYGPTETVVGCCVEEVTAGCWRPGPVAIGRPIANTRLYVLDARLRPVPVGVPGELFIGGDGLARGYLGRPDLTEKSFVANPLPEEKGEKLYRTGDLARHREDGSLEYLGRADDQVKIRGYRIELGEIESLLRRHPSVRQAAVAVAPDRSGEPRLVGYVATEGEYAPRREELRRFLAETLPEYMIPGAFVEVDELPLTSNGKVDRHALPAPPEEDASPSASGAPPGDETQRKLSAIWSEVLGIPEIGVDRNFFDLGGHSVLAARIFARIEETFGVRLPLAVLVECPTIEGLAGALAGNRWENAWSSLVPLQPNGTKPPLYCFHPIGGNVVGYVDLARRLGVDQPLWGVQAVGLDGKRPRHKSIDDMADHYVAEIREFQPDGPYYLAGSSFGGTLAFEAAQRLRAQGAVVAFVGMFDTWGPDYRRREDLGKRAEWMARTLARVELHLGNFLAAKGAGAKARYVASKAARVAHDVGKRARRFGRRFRQERPAALARTLVRVEQSALQAKKAYVPSPYPGKLTLFRASRQPSWFHPDPRLGWGRLAAGELEIHEVPGHHGALVHEPRVAVLAVKLEECLARAREETDSGTPREAPSREIADRRAG